MDKNGISGFFIAFLLPELLLGAISTFFHHCAKVDNDTFPKVQIMKSKVQKLHFGRDSCASHTEKDPIGYSKGDSC